MCWFKGPLLIASDLCQCAFQSLSPRICQAGLWKNSHLHPLRPAAWRPVTLRVSLKRYSGFMPQGLGEHSLHFRTINSPLFPVTTLLMLEGGPGTVVPDFDDGCLLKHGQRLAWGCVRPSRKRKPKQKCLKNLHSSYLCENGPTSHLIYELS